MGFREERGGRLIESEGVYVYEFGGIGDDEGAFVNTDVEWGITRGTLQLRELNRLIRTACSSPLLLPQVSSRSHPTFF